MREIKFREWDIINNQMIQHSNLSIGLKNINKKNSQFIYMQFTGICDQSGREIYEGDIIYWVSQNSGIERMGNVIFKSLGSVGYYISVNKEGNFELNSFESMGYQVIGNIYENSEAWEQKK